MPIIKSAKKAARQSVKRKSKNEAIKKLIRNALKEFRKKPSSKLMAIVQSEYDKAVKKGLMKKNTASRRKANLVRYAKAHDMKLEGGKKTVAEKAAATKKVAPSKEAATGKTVAKKTTSGKKSTATSKTAAAKKTATTKKAAN